MSCVTIMFCEKDAEDEILLNHYMDYYPSYQAGQTIWLEVNSIGEMPEGIEKIPLAEYKILKVSHSIRHSWSYTKGVVDNMAHDKIEVVIEKIKERK